MARDFYETLGVSKGASEDDIKKAFRKKAHELHPDKGGDAEAFKHVNEAYQVLGNAQKRAQYDQFGHAAFQQGGMGGAGGFGGFDPSGFQVNVDDLGDLGDILGNMFGFGGGGRRQGAGPRAGRDVETTVTISFLDAFKGKNQEISLRTLSKCDTCKGSGAVDGKTTACKACDGKGQVTRAQRTPFGVIQTNAACQECHGRGAKPVTPCATCGGSGVAAQNRTISLQIPAGISDGETIKLRGQGEAAPFSGATGDLYVHIRVAAHPHFQRDGNHILSEEHIPLTTLLLGGTVQIETADGSGELRIPAGTASGTLFKLRGYGFPFLHGHGKGDHMVTVIPDISKKLTKEQKKLLEELKEKGM